MTATHINQIMKYKKYKKFNYTFIEFRILYHWSVVVEIFSSWSGGCYHSWIETLQLLTGIGNDFREQQKKVL